MDHPVFGNVGNLPNSVVGVGFKQAQEQKPLLAKTNREFILGKSRFIQEVEVPFNWFTKSWADFNSKTMESKTPQVLEIDDSDKKKFNDSLQKTIDDLSRFVIDELTPINLCFKSAVEKSYETIGLMMDGVEMDKPDLTKYQKICSDLTVMKFIRFLSTSSSLNEVEHKILVDKYVLGPRD